MLAAPRRLLGRALERPLVLVALITVVACAIRLIQLTGQPLRWDEGWSLAHASLPWSRLWEIAALEWHPPLYAALLKLWLVTGRSAAAIRGFSVLASTLAVPLAWGVALAWSGSRRTALLTAGLVAVWPLLVLYGQMARMYALAELFVLAAAWFLLRREAAPSRWNDLGLVLSSAAALYTFYYTALALAGLWLYAWVAGVRRPRRLLVNGALVALAFAPWLVTAAATLLRRLGGPAGGEEDVLLGTLRLLWPTLQTLLFDLPPARFAGLTVGLVLVGAPVAMRPRAAELRPLLLPLAVVGLTVLGVAYGAHAVYWLTARHLVAAAPFFALALAWALDRLSRRSWALLAVALLALGIVYWPHSTRTVYEKPLEVVDPFDPAAEHAYLASSAGPRDLALFNTLAHAGWYESLRGPGDPPWALALRWDPIVEPMESLVPRLQQASAAYRCLWFALYKGGYDTNGPLLAWLDASFYPAAGHWDGDTLYAAYVAPRDLSAAARPDARFSGGIRLAGARWTGATRAGDACTLELEWTSDASPSGDYKVFVHAVDAAGALVTQHDAIPAAGGRPTGSWQPGETILDRHALLLPAGQPAPAELTLRVGLYDTGTGERLLLADGRDYIDLGVCAVQAP